MQQNISVKDLSKHPEPYHDIVVQIYNDNKTAIQNTIKNGFGDSDLKILVWMNLLSILMESVEKFTNASGPLKKRIVLEICLVAVEQSELTDENKYLFKTLINKLLPELIDMVVLVSNKINLDKSKCGRVFKRMFCCHSELPEPEQEINILEPVTDPELKN